MEKECIYNKIETPSVIATKKHIRIGATQFTFTFAGVGSLDTRNRRDYEAVLSPWHNVSKLRRN